jgi:hypothetical protein
MNPKPIITGILSVIALTSCSILSNNTFFNNQNSNNISNNNNVAGNNNTNVWSIYDSKDSLSDESKSFKKYFNNGEFWYREIENFNTSKNFSIAFTAKINNFIDADCCIDLQWGDLNIAKKLYKISFYTTETIRLDYFDMEWTSLYKNELTSKPGNPLKFNELNHYEVLQKGDSCLVYINKIKVFSEPIKAIGGKGIGIQQKQKNSWFIKKIELRQNSGMQQ